MSFRLNGLDECETQALFEWMNSIWWTSGKSSISGSKDWKVTIWPKDCRAPVSFSLDHILIGKKRIGRSVTNWGDMDRVIQFGLFGSLAYDFDKHIKYAQTPRKERPVFAGSDRVKQKEYSRYQTQKFTSFRDSEV